MSSLPMSARNPALATSPAAGFWSLSKASETCAVSGEVNAMGKSPLHRRQNKHEGGEASPEGHLELSTCF